MPYDKDTIPTENAPALRSHDLADYKFQVDLWQADVDDLALFDTENPGGGKQTLDFLDRVVVGGVRGKGIPYPVLKKLFQQIGDAMKEANSAGN
jgi:hypothetical protein